MEAGDGSTVVNNPAVIKAAQEEIGRLNVLVCGQCHLVFHFIEEFQEHQNKEGACTKTSHFRDNGNNEQKAQVWAFLLWKDTQIQQETTDKDSVTSWKLYQKWCKMEQHVRETWITAGRTIQAFTKINNAKMTDMRSHNTDGVKQPIIVRKVVRNGQPEDSSEVKKKEIKSEVKAESSESAPTTTTTTTAQTKKVMQNRPKAFVKPRVRPGKTQPDDEPNDEEFAVEKIMAKRYNTKKRCAEYYLKWEGYAPEFNTWESADVVSCCKFLLEEFERNLAKQKEMKELKAQQLAQQQQQQQQQQTTKIINRTVTQKTIIKAEPSTPGPSSAAQITRPMRSSKSKAMDQVKQWCGSMKEEDNDILGKRRADLTDSDSDTTAAKRAKGEGASDEDYTGESEEERNTTGRSDVIQRAFNRANAQSNGSNKTVSSSDLATSLGLQSPDPTKTHQSPVLVANAKGVVKVDPKQMPNLASGVYVMSKKEGIIKLDSSPAGKQIKSGTGGVLMVPNRENPTVVRRQVITASQANSITPVKVVSKPDGSQVVTQMKVISKQVPAKPRQSLGPKNEPVKIQPKPDPTQLQQIHVVTAVQNPIGMQPRITTNVRPSIQQQQQQQKTADGRPLLPRPSVRGPGPTSVLGIGSIRSPVRAPTPRLQTPQTRAPMQKRVVAGSPQATMSPTQQTQLRAKYIASPNQIVKTVVSTAQLKQSPGNKLSPGNKQTQSLISPQQKTLMTKRKTQELTPQGVVKTPMKTMVNTKAPAGRGRGKITTTTPVATPGKPKETKIVESGGLHMEFQENPPESPERPFTLCPLTGRIIGEDGEPVAEAEPTPSHTSVDTIAASSITGTTVTATTSAGESMDTSSCTTTTTTELVLPSLESLTETNSIMRVEMSPGGTTGTIVQASTDPTAQLSLAGVTIAPDLPCLDDTATTSVTSVQSTISLTETIASDAIATTTGLTGTIVTSSASNVTNVKQEIKDEERKVVADDASNVVTITGEDGVVYQVAGHAEDGQTLLVTRGADGEQQCVYVTTEQQGDEGSVLTLDHAVAEAVAQLMPDQVNLAPQFYVKEGEGEATENQMVMSIMDNSAAGAVGSQEDPEGQAQVVAQVVQADEPTPGGTRRVVLLLPDGNLMMTEVDEEQYAALELDK
ncbi:chromodomain-containing protein chromator isoform X2 [Cotesia typhae]|uniref:chromodomain-containing protein chromator isoform X2 n=1 Tax=Cotesia typhae TaxID=2053667 RepID=UPI003D6972DC